VRCVLSPRSLGGAHALLPSLLRCAVESHQLPVFSLSPALGHCNGCASLPLLAPLSLHPPSYVNHLDGWKGPTRTRVTDEPAPAGLTIPVVAVTGLVAAWLPMALPVVLHDLLLALAEAAQLELGVPAQAEDAGVMMSWNT
jgi:hypothetical protein